MIRKNTGFTLIELLVVVLIIGILAAVAVPQYQKSVEKGYAPQMMFAVRSVAQAQQRYYLENGNFADKFSDLDIDYDNLPLKPATFSPYGLSSSDAVRGNNNFVVFFAKTTRFLSIIAVRTTGKYAHAGFEMYLSDNVTPDVNKNFGCVEIYTNNRFTGAAGSYCGMFATSAGVTMNDGSGSRYYAMN